MGKCKGIEKYIQIITTTDYRETDKENQFGPVACVGGGVNRKVLYMLELDSNHNKEHAN